MGILWFCALLITHGVAYFWGYSSCEERLDAKDHLELQKYRYDKFYEHQRWREERRAGHDLPDA